MSAVRRPQTAAAKTVDSSNRTNRG